MLGPLCSVENSHFSTFEKLLKTFVTGRHSWPHQCSSISIPSVYFNFRCFYTNYKDASSTAFIPASPRHRFQVWPLWISEVKLQSWFLIENSELNHRGSHRSFTSPRPGCCHQGDSSFTLSILFSNSLLMLKQSWIHFSSQYFVVGYSIEFLIACLLIHAGSHFGIRVLQAPCPWRTLQWP